MTFEMTFYNSLYLCSTDLKKIEDSKFMRHIICGARLSNPQCFNMWRMTLEYSFF